jgi:hypothetical protein
MFQRIDLSPGYDRTRADAVQKRWETPEGRDHVERIIALVRNGGGEDFLQWEFENGSFPLLEDQWDLAGFQMFNEEIHFPDGDNFEAINFSYGRIWHSKFVNACFPSTRFSFARFYNVEFQGCLFALASFYNATFEKCRFLDCDFAEGNGFTNCDMVSTVFSGCFFENNKFEDCRFDENTSVSRIQTKPRRFNEILDLKNVSGLHRGIKDAFVAGGVISLARKHRFLVAGEESPHA